jgi:hypothetical protein
MAKSPVTVTRKGDSIRDLKQRLEVLQNTDLLIGIPAASAGRKGKPVSNAQLLFIHTYGSPLRNIPARPVLQPAINANWNLIGPIVQDAARKAMLKDVQGAMQTLRRAGLTASNAAKRWFTDSRNGWAPNAPSTIRRKGSDRPLVDTGQMRRSITYILRQKQKLGLIATEQEREKHESFTEKIAEAPLEIVSAALELVGL